jgi:hypothetical protein
MKKIIVTMIVMIFASVIVFTGCQYLMVNTKDSIVDPKKYLGNQSNPADIYAAQSKGIFYSPLNIDVVSMDKLMLIDIEDDPEYLSIELQTFDDTRGRGARVLLYHHDGPADSYYTSETFVSEESENDKSHINPDMKYHLNVTDSGLDASLRMRDHEGKAIEFQVRETFRKKWSKGFLAPIGASDAITFQYFPFFHMKNMNFVLRSGTEITVKIGGEERKPKKLPIPADLEFVYLSRYTPAPIIACWNSPHDGELYPLKVKGQSVHQNEKTAYELVNNDGHCEIRKMCGLNERHAVSFDFSPPIPDLICLKDGADLKGRFCAGADGIPGIVAGTYSVRRQGNVIDMEIRPQEGWQPTPGQLWVKSWVWKSTIKAASDNSVSMKSFWIREEQKI